MKRQLSPDVARLICGNIDDLRNYLSSGSGPGHDLLERALAACTGRERKTKRALLEAALRKLHGPLPETQPCPFCGRLPAFSYIEDGMVKGELDRGFYSLTCHSKKHMCPVAPMAQGETKAEAIAKWNMRAPTQLAPALAACRAIRFAHSNAVRHGGDYSLNDLLAADRLAAEALKPAMTEAFIEYAAKRILAKHRRQQRAGKGGAS